MNSEADADMTVVITSCAVIISFIAGAVCVTLFRKKSKSSADDVKAAYEEISEILKHSRTKIRNLNSDSQNNDLNKLLQQINKIEEEENYLRQQLVEAQNLINLQKIAINSLKEHYKPAPKQSAYADTSKTDSKIPADINALLNKNTIQNQNNPVNTPASQPINPIPAPQPVNPIPVPQPVNPTPTPQPTAPRSCSMKEVFAMVRTAKENSAEYKRFNVNTGRVEYSSDPKAPYILSADKQYLLPNFESGFQKTSLAESVYKCSSILIYETNKITLCEINGSGQIIRQGTIS